MNSHRPGDKTLIWHGGGMRAGWRRFCDRAGVTPILQKNQRNRALRGPASNDRQDTIGLKQSNQAQVAATRLAKIRRRDPSEAPLSP
jgi:hypothetical protein